jgi:hypothetical protein
VIKTLGVTLKKQFPAERCSVLCTPYSDAPEVILSKADIAHSAL